jgi:hypothetical protein
VQLGLEYQSDCAAAAMCAYARVELDDELDPVYNPADVLTFWTWWHEEAVPQAWEAAQRAGGSA